MKKHMGERGQVLPLVAISLAVLMGFGGIAVDVGYLQYEKHQQQTATDAAALGGVRALMTAGCPNQGAASAAANHDAALNSYSNVSEITTANPPASGPFAPYSCAVDVQIRRQHPTFFSNLFGLHGDEMTEAVAVISNDTNGCIYLLQPSLNTNFNGNTVNAPKCSIQINGYANMHNSSVTAAEIGYSQTTPNELGATFGEATPAPSLPLADPCPDIAGCEYLAQNPPPQTGCVAWNGSSGNIPAGCYSSINASHATITMGPGLIVLTGATNFNGATVTANGVTLYAANNTAIPNFNGVTSFTLSPPTQASGQPSWGVAYYQPPSVTSAANFNMTGISFSGLVYAPAATVNFNKSNTAYTVLVAGALNLNGNFTIDAADPSPTTSLIREAVLAQ